MLFAKKKKMIDLNEYTSKELQVFVENYIREYHSNKNKNKIFKELSKLDEYLLQMRKANLSLESIRKFLIEFYGYTVGIHTLSEYFKLFHGIENNPVSHS